MLFSEWLGKMYTMDQYLQECIAPACKEYHLTGTEMTALLFLYNNPEKKKLSVLIEEAEAEKVNKTNNIKCSSFFF